ncbi:hypothetical protein JTB14_009012 [Gonioctena quinquepunctata]|nr:hypothetical protein JTB14_009012 [Gonioctena quinquepunctata]
MEKFRKQPKHELIIEPTNSENQGFPEETMSVDSSHHEEKDGDETSQGNEDTLDEETEPIEERRYNLRDRDALNILVARWMPKDEDDESTSEEDSQTEYHIYHEDTDTKSIDSENSTFENPSKLLLNQSILKITLLTEVTMINLNLRNN